MEAQVEASQAGMRSSSIALPYPGSESLRRSPAIGDRVARLLALIAGAVTLLLLLGLAAQLVKMSMPAIQIHGWKFLTRTTWDPAAEEFGILPFLYGTLLTSMLALLLATPFAVGTALYLTELAPRRLRAPISFVLDMLAAIPSVVYGLWGIFVLAPFVASDMGPFLQKWLGFLPLFEGPSYGVSILTASLILAVMIVPFITAISREVLATVPQEVKAASYALGATQWETISRVVLPYSRAGIGAGIVLALGRALGETMAVTMLIGNSAQITASLLKPGYSMAAVIANEFTEATTPTYLAALVEVGLVLFVVTLLLNGIARYVLRRLQHVHAR